MKKFVHKKSVKAVGHLLSRDMSEKIRQVIWFSGGALCGLAMLSICKASIPASNSSADRLNPSNITNDTAIYQNLSEIQVRKEKTPNFDADISKLSEIETRYRERPAVVATKARATQYRQQQQAQVNQKQQLRRAMNRPANSSQTYQN